MILCNNIELLELKIKHGNRFSQFLSKDKRCPVELLEILSIEEWYIRDNVAENPNTPIKILEKLSKDEYWLVRNNVAENPNTPIEILEQLSKDGKINVRESALHSLSRT